MATLPQGLYGLRPPNPVTMALVGEPPLVAGDPVAALRAYAATLPPGVAAGPVKTAASGPDWGKIGDYLLTKSWPSRMVQAAWSAATLPGDVYAGRVDPNSDEGIARANDLAGLVTLGSGAVPGGGLRAGAKIAKAAPDEPAGIRVYHGSPHADNVPSMAANELIPIFRGESAYNKGGSFFTPDEEWARQFTQSGQRHEVLKRHIRAGDVYDPPVAVYAGDPDAVDAAIAAARGAGKKAVRLSEGPGEPQSLFVFDKGALRRLAK